MSQGAPQVPGYACERLLGEGAYGAVWLARETEGLRRPVALKLFAPERRAAFERELELVRRVEELRRASGAGQLVQALGSGQEGERGWIALEWLEGGSLDEVAVREGPLPAERVLAIAREVGAALQLLHGAGLFHRDVKPQNLLLGADGRTRLGDFGLSRELQGSLSAAGSPAFAAPEVIAGRPVDGRRADVYSLGATLAFLLTGETILPGRPDAFALERRGVPRPLTLALMRACALDPAERTADASAFLAELEGVLPESPRTMSGGRDGGGEGANEAAPQETPVTETRTEALIQDVEQRHTRPAPRTARSAILSLVAALLVLPTLMVAAGLGMFMARTSRAQGFSSTQIWDEPDGRGGRSYLAERRALDGAVTRIGPHATAEARDLELAELERTAAERSASEERRGLALMLGLNVGLPLLLELTAIVSGILALGWIARSGGALAGRGVAIAGLVIGGVNLAAVGCVALAVLGLAVKQEVR